MNYRIILYSIIFFIIVIIIVIGVTYILKPDFFKKSPALSPSNNVQNFDYSKLNTQSFTPSIIDVPPIIKGSVISTALASNEYNKNYRLFSDTNKVIVIKQDTIGPKYSELKPKVLEDLGTNDNIFEWKDGDKCYIPDNYIPEKNDYKRDRNNNIKDAYIVLGECNKNNAKYKIINGYIQHIDTNKYLRPISDLNNSSEFQHLILSNLIHEEITMKDEENKDQKLTFPTVFIKKKSKDIYGKDIEENNDIEKIQFYFENGKLKHKTSDYCITPYSNSNSNSNIILSLVDCKKLPK